MLRKKSCWLGIFGFDFFRLLVTGQVGMDFSAVHGLRVRELGPRVAQSSSSSLRQEGAGSKQTHCGDLNMGYTPFYKISNKNHPFFSFFKKNNIQKIFGDMLLRHGSRWIAKRTLLPIYIGLCTSSCLERNCEKGSIPKVSKFGVKIRNRPHTTL